MTLPRTGSTQTISSLFRALGKWIEFIFRLSFIYKKAHFSKRIYSLGFKSVSTPTAVILPVIGMPPHLRPRVNSSSINICWYLQLKVLEPREVGTLCKQKNPDEIQYLSTMYGSLLSKELYLGSLTLLLTCK